MRFFNLYAPLAGLIVLAALAGYTTGRIVSFRHFDAPLGYAVREDTAPRTATVLLDRMESGELVGTIHGDVRLFVEDRMAVHDGSGSFRIAAGPLLTEVIPVVVPPGMRFVASKRGSRFYAVESASAQSIVPANRIYFATQAEARAAGYR